ncbi:Golgi-associated plant pathogenesis-related protein 1 [Thelohanellus kitauei]|uniref:Golgi-associated plant pathogenesis-related protein 1 n=1 Tax=Thelohanellus kitauei TaxID=669202 RepID=A0A0C2IVP2_THEKT|nr:Golgi-associated plant pathogenesis-related protein 1 [Thelohanellus kitauei]
MLEIHNDIRVYHNAYPLVLKDYMCEMAQQLSEKLILYKMGKSEEPGYPDLRYGKSITYVVGRELPSAKSICSSWYDGNRFYDFSKNVYNKQNGGFTQLIWKASKYVGFGVYWGDNRSIIVALYYPAGNIKGQYEENVEPSRGSP